MFLGTFASMGVRRLKETFIEANKVLHCPLLLLDTLFSSCCRENGTEEKLHFTDNVLVGFLRETRGQSSKSPQFFLWEVLKRGCIVPSKGILIISNGNLPPREETLYFVIYIFFCFFLSPCCVYMWVFCGGFCL